MIDPLLHHPETVRRDEDLRAALQPRWRGVTPRRHRWAASGSPMDGLSLMRLLR